MAYHIVFNRPTNLSSATEGAHSGLNPRHSMAALAEALGARVHDGSGQVPDWIDRLVGKLTRTQPLWWSIARKLRREVGSGDVVYCTGEDIGVPVATLCGGLCGVEVVMMAHFVDRTKGRWALRLFGLRHKAALFFAVSRPQSQFLQRFLGDPRRAEFVWDQTDTQFFTPGPMSPGKIRPMVMSVGLEQRDYGSLALATADMDIDVRISGYSADTKVIARAFPQHMPANMDRRFYAWPDLLQLYRDADVVVVSLHPNNYAAGVQVFMEALSCGRPVVVTRTEGLEGYLDRPEAMRIVPPADPASLRAAIAELLAAPQTRIQMGEAAAALARERHRFEDYVGTIAERLKTCAERAARGPPRIGSARTKGDKYD